MTSRRQFLVAGVAGSAAMLAVVDAVGTAAGTTAPPEPAAAGFTFAPQAQRLFKRGTDRNRLRHEQWLATLVLRSLQPRKPALDRLVVTSSAAGNVVRATTIAGPALLAFDLVPAVSAAADGAPSLVAAFHLADSLPAALAVDHVHCALTWAADGGGTQTISSEFALETYAQKTALVFPFRGRGVITQGGAWNDGHRNRSGMFAVDAIGVDADYAPQRSDDETPAATTGWGRDVIAPAAGTVVVARGDRPDQPVTGVSDPQYFVAEHAQGGDPGNHCVIDHGNGEFSMLAHFRHDSLRVAVGDRVTQGQVLGQLGNSGDTDWPHVHHQLQTGPDWMQADALPHVYMNGPRDHHDRGEFFDAGAPT
jgi:hypothetical protein